MLHFSPLYVMLLRSKDKPDVGSMYKEEEGAPDCDSLPSGSRRLLHSSYKLLLLRSNIVLQY